TYTCNCIQNGSTTEDDILALGPCRSNTSAMFTCNASASSHAGMSNANCILVMKSSSERGADVIIRFPAALPAVETLLFVRPRSVIGWPWVFAHNGFAAWYVAFLLVSLP